MAGQEIQAPLQPEEVQWEGGHPSQGGQAQQSEEGCVWRAQSLHNQKEESHHKVRSVCLQGRGEFTLSTFEYQCS